ncbi:hypothetical protein [Brumimicrobium mesophilum]|uniref:hypothetical protein n=1 Tax=Brumimicrobium mesophilum TaxID=392717 RepID=UPI00131E6BC5|nr:hypothetical protein [Brumimicrobium mesophilum]
MSSKFKLDDSISNSDRMDIIENRMKKLGYNYHRKLSKIHFGNKTPFLSGRFAYSYLLFGVTKHGYFEFEKN